MPNSTQTIALENSSTRISPRPPGRMAMAVIAALAGLLLAAAGTAAAEPLPSRCSAPASLNSAASSDGQLRYRFMGTTTLLFDDGETQILIDGFFSRPSLARSAIGRVGPNCARIEEALEKAGITTRLKAIFVAHAHVDHVLDAPEIAFLTGAELIGSESVKNVALGHGLPPGRIKEGRHRIPCGYGRFRITPILTPHSTPNVAWGRVSRPVPRHSWAQFYRARDSFAFLIEHGDHSLLVYPSTAFAPNRLNGFAADIVFLGISGLGRRGAGFADRYWDEVMGTVGGKLVYPIHWDDFGRPLSEDLRPMPWPFDNVRRGRAHVRRLADEHGVTLGELTRYDTVVAPPPSAGRAGRRSAAPSPPPCPTFGT